jgi:hypothetical protein
MNSNLRAPEILHKTAAGKKLIDGVFHSDDFATGETITGTPVITSTPSGQLTIGAPTKSGFTVQALVESGVDGTEYSLAFTVDTSLGQKLTRFGILRVED